MENEQEKETALGCSEVRDLLYLYVCGELDPEEAGLVKDHLEGCADCRLAFQEHQRLNEELPAAFINRKLFYYSRNA